MKIRLINNWEKLRASYWFLPILLAVLAVLLAAITVNLDQMLWPAGAPAWIDAGRPEGVRNLLSTVAGSMITMASVTFSITIVALTMASSQFGPRLLNNFMRDTSNQVVLGTFIATFIYSLLVLRAVGNVTAADNNVPHLSVAVAFLLTLVSLGLFIYFIHHVSVSINVQNVTAAVEKELNAAIARLYPQKQAHQSFVYQLRREDDMPLEFEADARRVAAVSSGYLQTIDHDRLLKLATEQSLLLRLEVRPGDFVASGSSLVRIWPPAAEAEEIEHEAAEQGEDAEQDEDPEQVLAEAINKAFLLGSERLRLQDVKFAIDQLVEIALRALSPGINDPFTAIACVDRLGAALANAAERRIPSGYRYDEENQLRLITNPVTFAGLVDAAFNQIRQNSRSSVPVTMRLLEAITVIAAHTRTPADRETLWRQAILIKQGLESAFPQESDRQDVLRKFELVRQAIKDNKNES